MNEKLHESITNHKKNMKLFLVIFLIASLLVNIVLIYNMRSEQRRHKGPVQIMGLSDIKRDKRLRHLYDFVSKEYEVGNYAEFRRKMHIHEKRRIFYNEISRHYYIGYSFEDFEEYLYFSH